MHAIWVLLLSDKEFMHAYKHGIVVECADGILRRLFPRLLTYSADYPEKVLLASIKYLGRCPCPRCLVEKKQIPEMGTIRDMKRRERLARVDTAHLQHDVNRAREYMFQNGVPATGASVEGKLGATSRVPTRNAFSLLLLALGINFYLLFVVDLLHEFELGVAKAVITHLIRIMYALAGDTITIFNERFRSVPTFGRDTIRKFHNNVSDLKKLAARDYEDILQCAMPVFEGLFPSPFDGYIQDLLFDLAEWHAYAKLRMHTDSTIASFRTATASLGQQMRKFSNKTCAAFFTKETPREEAARHRRAAAKLAKSTGSTSGNPPPAPRPRTSGAKRRKFNLFTYKYHSLADYIWHIIHFGTTDSYSTQIGELEHRRVKRFYVRSNKNKYARQCARHERRERMLSKRKIRNAKGKAKAQEKTTSLSVASAKATPSLAFSDSDKLAFTSPKAHHHISESNRFKQDIPSWLGANAEDPALKDFLPRLKGHLLSRLLQRPYTGDEDEFTADQLRQVCFKNNRLYRHKVIRVNYTTYDVRRAQDSLNPRTHADFMVLGHDEGLDAYPYWFGRIVGVFHAEVLHTGDQSTSAEPQRMEFLWVRWFLRDTTHKSGSKAKRLCRIAFDDDEDYAFGFLDPKEIIRAVHLIPAFAHGRSGDALGPSLIRHPREKDEDWNFYYVSRWVDRDMFMRFRGGGVGHRYARAFEHQLGEMAEMDELVVEDEDDTPIPEANAAGPGSDSEGQTDSEGDDPEGGEEDEEESDGDEGYDSNEGDQGLGAEDGDEHDDPDEDAQYAGM
ncbi:hypothetical protein FIBSPDRAFT_1055351 [Athelia psychrophila]|nr:hypothetical protein FIBSPDRAFT_1055351 [Fibularhizoctonia sp. CBS 109695]